MIIMGIVVIAGTLASMYLVERYRREQANPEQPWGTDRWRRRLRHRDDYTGRHWRG